MSADLIALRAALVDAGEGAKVGPRPTARTIERARLCRQIDDFLADGLTVSTALRRLRAAESGLPSDNTLRRWLAAWRDGGVAALADGRDGRTRLPYGWEARAIEEWNEPQRPSRATVAWRLRQDGFADATDSRVRRFLNSLPANIGGENTPARAGAHHHRQNFRPHVIRDESVIPVGLIYEGDGHTCDVYVQHPNSGQHYRPEITVWLDINTHFCVGFNLAEAESAMGTLHSLSGAFLAHDHVPAALHVDPGSGFRNRLMIGETVGWLSRLGVDVIYALPGNAKGKGLVERWFGTFEERCGKRFRTYCGHCRTDDELRYLKRAIRGGKLRLPHLREYAEAVAGYISAYNSTPQKRLGAAPAELWAQGLRRSPVHVPRSALLRPAERRAVRKATVEIFGRKYRAPALNLVNGQTVDVEYDLTDDSRVWINFRGRRVCEARLAEARPWLPKSRVEDLQAKREAGQLKRLERKAEEARARQRKPLDGQAVALDALALPEPEERPAEIDPYSCLPD